MQKKNHTILNVNCIKCLQFVGLNSNALQTNKKQTRQSMLSFSALECWKWTRFCAHPTLTRGPSLPRRGRAPCPRLRLHLRDRVPHQSRERVPQPAARGSQRAAHAEKHAAGHQVSLMERLIGFSLVVFYGRSAVCLAFLHTSQERIPNLF